MTAHTSKNTHFIAAFSNEKFSRLGKEEECVQFPAGCLKWATRTLPRRYKVTAVAAHWFTNEIGFEDELAFEREEESISTAQSFPRMEFWK